MDANFDLQVFLIDMKRDLQADIKQNHEEITKVNGTVRLQDTRITIVETKQKWTLRGLWLALVLLAGSFADRLHLP